MDETRTKKIIASVMQAKVLIPLVIFLISFVYILFFSECVPFFFDDHEFNTFFAKISFKDLFSGTFNFNKGDISAAPRFLYVLFFKVLYPQVGFDYCAYRIAKAPIFSLLIVVIYFFVCHLFKRKSIAAGFSLYFMVTFPLYLQTLGYSGPHIFAEIPKLLALLLFLVDIRKEKTSYLSQFCIFFLMFLAIRTYAPAYALAGVLPLFTLLYDRKKFKRYMLLFFLLIMIQFPITFEIQLFDPNSTGNFSPKFVNIKRVFTNFFIESITSPIPSLGNLYYKSFYSIISFFGLWLLFFVSIGLLLKSTVKKWREKYFITSEQQRNQAEEVDHKLIFILTAIWMLAEIQNYIFLPEHAIRYLFAFLLPFSIFALNMIVLLIKDIRHEYKKFVTLFIIIMVLGVIFTNGAYVYSFRAGWGSSFFAFEEVMDYFAENHETNTGVLYNAWSAATEYKYINKSSEKYLFDTASLKYIKNGDIEEFQEERIDEYAQQYNSFFVLKRVTSLSKTEFPAIDFTTYRNLKEIKKIEGINKNTLFDGFNMFIISLFNIEYAPNMVYIYQYVGNATEE